MGYSEWGYDEWVKRTARDLVSSGGEVSMGDIESVATAIALTHIMDDDVVIRDIRDAIEDLLVPPNRDVNGLWMNDDLQRAIDYVKNNVDFAQKVMSKISVSDSGSVAYVIKRGCAEDFDRYDSAVAEQFIIAYLNVAEPIWDR